jgi:hypothetical protein
MPTRVIFRCDSLQGDPARRPVVDAEMGSAMSDPAPLLTPVFDGRAYKPFGEFTLADVEARASELAGVTGWGPTARVASVARGWSELARAMASAGAAVVAELGSEAAGEFARRVWVVPPGGSLI